MKLAVVVTALCLTGCQQASWEEMRATPNVTQSNDKPAVPTKSNFEMCASQTLTVDVPNAKSSLKDFQVTTARYPWIKVTKAKSTKTTVTYFLNASDGKRACQDADCATRAGWVEVQNDLLALSDFEVGCLAAAESPED